MKKHNIIIASAALLATTAFLSVTPTNNQPVFAAETATTAATADQTISMNVYKTGTTQSSMAANFIGSSAKVSIANGKVQNVYIHVDGSSAFAQNMIKTMGKGKNIGDLISSLSLNGVSGTKTNISADGLDYVFPASAYKEGKGTLNVVISLPGMPLNEQADVVLGKVSLPTPKPAADTNKSNKTNNDNKPSQPATQPTTSNNNTNSVNTTVANQTTPSTKQETTTAVTPVTTNSENSTNTVVANQNSATTNQVATTTKSHASTNNENLTSKNTTKNAKKHATKRVNKHVNRRLKHNAYIYNKRGRRVTHKVLKKGKHIKVYSKAIKIHGKYYYQISKNRYVKKANFR